MVKKHIFILNPAAGQGKALRIREEIESAAERLGEDAEIYETEGVLDAKKKAEEISASAGAENPVRIYACGGDGTVNEVLNGTAGNENIELAIVPAGTGNDFVRNFGSIPEFLDIEDQMRGNAVSADCIRYRSTCRGEVSEGYFINMINIGFDCNVVDAAARLKKKPFISGPLAYLLGVVEQFIGMNGSELRISDSEKIYEGSLLLTAVGNGSFCGGGVKGVPLADTSDGLMDLSIVKKCSRKRFLRLFPEYMKGTHIDLPEAEDLLIYRKVDSLTIETLCGPVLVSTDGEISQSEKIEMNVCSRSVKLNLPQKVYERYTTVNMK